MSLTRSLPVETSGFSSLVGGRPVTLYDCGDSRAIYQRCHPLQGAIWLYLLISGWRGDVWGLYITLVMYNGGDIGGCGGWCRIVDVVSVIVVGGG